MNENYAPAGRCPRARRGIVKGMYRWTRQAGRRAARAADGLRHHPAEVIAAAELLDEDFGIAADIWSCPSFTELARDGRTRKRFYRLHPKPKTRARPTSPAARRPMGPAVAATDYVRAFAEDPRLLPMPTPSRHRRLRPHGHARGFA